MKKFASLITNMDEILKNLEKVINNAVVSYMHDEKNWGHSQQEAFRRGFIEGFATYGKIINNEIKI